MVKPVVKRGDPLLYAICSPVTDVATVQHVITDLWDTLQVIQGLYDFTRGSGIAAPQIGVSVQISVVQFGASRYVLINPSIIAHSSELMVVREGCLSFFDYRGMVERYAAVTIEAMDAAGVRYTIEADGDFASLLQHEIGHLQGELYESHLAPGAALYPVVMPAIP